MKIKQRKKKSREKDYISLATMKFCQEIEVNEQIQGEEERTWIFDNTGEISEEVLKNLITTYGEELTLTK